MQVRIVSLFLSIVVLFTVRGWSQQHVPGEYILKWKNKSAALIFEKQIRAIVADISYRGKTILEDDIYLQHVIVDPAQSDIIEAHWQKNSNLLAYYENKFLEERSIPDDPSFAQQWQYINNGVGGVANADLDIDMAWDITTGGISTGGDTIVICVIDEGINLDHPDLVGNVWINHHEIPGNGIDDDENGYVDDVRGWNVVTDNDDLSEGGSHGTPVCGIVGSKGNNGVGVAGVNWNVKIMFVKYGSATEANALAAYGYAYNMRKLYNETNGQKGAFVVVTNASWGVNDAFAEEAPLWCDFYDLLGEVGILSCGATTNRDVNVDISGDLPTTCESEYLLSVTNMTRFDQKLTGAGYGAKSIDLGAYGHQTYTLSRSADAAFGGTSGATPHVAGTIALLYAAPCSKLDSLVSSRPSAAALMVKDMVLNGTVPNAGLAGISTSGGRLNTNNALQEIMRLCEPCALPAGVQFIKNADSLTVLWLNENAPDNVAIRLRKTDKPDWIVYNEIDNGFIITGLDLCTEYEVQIGASCTAEHPEFEYSRYLTSGGCCPAPTHFNTSYLQGDIMLSWDSGIQGQVEYFVQIEDKFGNSKIEQVNVPVWTLEKPDSCGWYTLGIQAFCPGFGTQSDVIENIVINTSCGACLAKDYCILSRKNTSDEWIQSFRMGPIFQESGVDQNGYGNYLGKEIGYFVPDSAYEIQIIPGFSSSPFTEDYSVYADFNQDGFFSGDELIFTDNSASTSGVSGTVMIPGNALEGITRLRVIMAFQSHNSPCDAEDFEYGEWEEYCIKISREIPDCQLNDTLLVDTSNREQVLVYFSSLANAGQYAVVLRKEAGVLSDTFYVDTSPVVLMGLDSCTLYAIQIAPDCGLDSLIFTSEFTFLTACGTAVEESKIQGYFVYPNPFDQSLNIYYDPLYEPEHIFLSDITGREVQVVWQKSTGKLTCDGKMLQSGIYLIHINTKNARRTIKVIKI